MKESIEYLTVQDVLFAHFRIVGATTEFDYATLEEATFFQYGYGSSRNLVAQAARFATGFRKLRPFAKANLAVGFVALTAFMALNDYHLTIEPSQAAAWYESLSLEEDQAAIENAFTKANSHHSVSPQDAIMATLEEFREAVDQLIDAEVPIKSA